MLASPPGPLSSLVIYGALGKGCTDIRYITSRGFGGIWYNQVNTLPETGSLEGIEIARRAVDVASDKQASNIVLLDVRNRCGFTDYFVICAGESQRQLRAIYEEIEKSLKKEGVLLYHHEGGFDSGWLLLDYGDVIVHIFGEQERAFYNLDGLWHDARTVLRIQ
jgi:ribosome-associated protein